MDTRYRFVEELQRDELIKVKFVPSSKNLADGATKNVSGDILESHMDDYLVEKDKVI